MNSSNAADRFLALVAQVCASEIRRRAEGQAPPDPGPGVEASKADRQERAA
jgi:hypothetical protein